jgi:hypothetical protein
MALSKQLQRIHEAIMTIKQYGGVFGRNPTFNDVTIEGQLTFDGDIDINSDLKVSGDIETTGNVIIATSGKGIDFSATAGPNPPASGTSELLDDYEEGIWTPTIVGYTTSGAFTYDIQEGTYTKVGNLVTVHCAIYVTATATSPVGNVNIYGLPFTIGNQFPTFTIGWSQSITFADQLGAYGGVTEITLRNMLSGGSGALVSGADFGSSFYLFISGSYYV